VNGTWFLWAVSSHSVAIAAADLEVTYAGVRQYLAALAVLAWALGVVQYGVVVVVLLLKFANRPVRPADLDPSYWVSMGALAITAVAGAQITGMDSAPMVDATRAVIAGLSVITWCVATWLIPVLVAVGWWRHVRHRIPLRYEPALWSMVFPLGMYAVAGICLGRADDLPLVHTIGSAWSWVATAVWATVLAASTRVLPGGSVTANRRCTR
jgi:tellurite resistance protein TehA-like permease